MNYTRRSFSVALGASNISEDNWERTFGKKAAKADAPVPAPEASPEQALADLRKWPCENRCGVRLTNVEDADGDDPLAGDGHGYWFCGACWNSTLTKVCAERDEAKAEVARLTEVLRAATTP